MFIKFFISLLALVIGIILSRIKLRDGKRLKMISVSRSFSFSVAAWLGLWLCLV